MLATFKLSFLYFSNNVAQSIGNLTQCNGYVIGPTYQGIVISNYVSSCN